MEVIFFHFLDTPAGERYFLSSGNVFLNKFFIPYGGGGFPCLIFFSTSGRKPSLKLVEVNLFGKDFIPAERDFHPVVTVFFYSVLLSCKWKPILKLVETSNLYFLYMAVPYI